VCCTVSAENILCSALIKKKSVSIPLIRTFSEKAHAKVSDCYFDISARSIFTVLETYSDVFKWEDGEIQFTDYDKEHVEEIQNIFNRRLPNKVRTAFDNTVL